MTSHLLLVKIVNHKPFMIYFFLWSPQNRREKSKSETFYRRKFYIKLQIWPLLYYFRLVILVKKEPIQMFLIFMIVISSDLQSIDVSNKTVANKILNILNKKIIYFCFKNIYNFFNLVIIFCPFFLTFWQMHKFCQFGVCTKKMARL